MMMHTFIDLEDAIFRLPLNIPYSTDMPITEGLCIGDPPYANSDARAQVGWEREV
jgi:hypothetical protein